MIPVKKRGRPRKYETYEESARANNEFGKARAKSIRDIARRYYDENQELKLKIRELEGKLLTQTN
jgi:hypothetical protein